QTWRQFQNKCLQFQRYWQARGVKYRHAMELHEATAEDLTVMLLQRQINLIDNEGRLHVSDPRVAETLAFYAQLVAGPRQIGGESSANSIPMLIQDVSSGNLCAMFTPDWKSYYLEQDAADCAGKLRMMPLPRFETR